MHCLCSHLLQESETGRPQKAASTVTHIACIHVGTRPKHGHITQIKAITGDSIYPHTVTVHVTVVAELRTYYLMVKDTN